MALLDLIRIDLDQKCTTLQLISLSPRAQHVCFQNLMQREIS